MLDGDHFIGEVKLFGGNFLPQGWAFCNGQLLPIAQYQGLFALIGTAYGGDGKTTFGLPNLQARVPVGVGQGPNLSNRTRGQSGGQVTVTLTTEQLPQHSHVAASSEAKGNQKSPAGRGWSATADGANAYASGTANTTLKADALAATGEGKPHNNLPPYLCVSYIIAIEGYTPERA
mgnify:FL=1